MPIFEHKGKKYNVSDEYMSDFMREYPDATTIQENNGRKFRVRAADYNDYLQEVATEPAAYPIVEGVHALEPEQYADAPQTTASPVGSVVGEYDATTQPSDGYEVNGQQPTQDNTQWRTAMMMNAAGMNAKAEAAQDGTWLQPQRQPLNTGGNLLGTNPDPYKLGQNPRVQRVESKTDHLTGEQTNLYSTTDGTLYDNRTEADLAQFADEANITAAGLLRQADARIAKLEKQIAVRREEVKNKAKRDREQMPLLMRIANQMTENTKALHTYNMAAGDNDTDLLADDTYQALKASLDKAKERRQQLANKVDQEQNGDGFWRGFGRSMGQALTDIDNWTGQGDLWTQTALVRIQDKIEQGEQLSEAEQGALDDAEMTQAVMAMYGDLGAGYRWGNITGASIPFMAQFFVTKGGGQGINIVSKGIGKLAGKMGVNMSTELAKQALKKGVFKFVKEQGVKGVGNIIRKQALPWTIKRLGVTADELLVRSPLLTATLQSDRVAANAIEGKLGQLTYDEDTQQLRFANDGKWSNEVWEATADQVIENFSEMAGTHFPSPVSIGKAFGARNLTAAVLRKTRKGAGTVASKTNEFLKRMGINGYLGEVGEEYYGQLWRTMLDLDSAKDNYGNNLLGDSQWHGDILGGIGMSMGITGAVTLAGTTGWQYGKRAYDTAAHNVRINNAVRRANKKASKLFKQGEWDALRATIDGTENANMGALIDGLWYERHKKGDDGTSQGLNDEQWNATLGYIGTSMAQRGSNLAQMVMPMFQYDKLEERIASSYQDGYNNMDPVEMRDINYYYQLQRRRMMEQLGATEESLDSGIAYWQNEMAGTDEDADRKRAISNYLVAKATYEGMIQRSRDDLDDQISESNSLVDSRTNKNTQQIQSATLKTKTPEGQDQKVYVVKGNVVPLQDGTGIDRQASDQSIIVRNAETGEETMISPEALLNVDAPINAEQAKREAADAIRKKFGQERAAQIDGKVSFKEGDVYYADTQEGVAMEMRIVPNEQGVVDNGDGSVNVSTDGGKTIVPMQKDFIQGMVETLYRRSVEEYQADLDAEWEEEKRKRAQQPAQPAQTGGQTAGQQQPQQPQQPQQQPRQYALNDELTFTYPDGTQSGARINEVDDSAMDGSVRYLVQTDTPPQGKAKVDFYTQEELDALTQQQQQQQPTAEQPTTEQPVQPMQPTAQQQPPIEQEPQPVGRNAFGNVYQWALGKAKEAASFLRRMQGGYLRGVFHRQDIGDIDMAWGNEKGGLRHIIQKHIVEHDDFDSVDQAMQVIDDVLTNGQLTMQKGGAKVEKDGYRVALRQNEDGTWVISAYDITRQQEEKRRNAPGTLSDQAGQEGGNGTLVSPSVSTGKDTQNPADSQAQTAENALSPIPTDEKGNPLYHQAPIESTLADLNDGSLTPKEVDDFIAKNIEKAQKDVADLTKKQPKMSTNKAQYLADKQTWQQQVDEANKRVQYWNDVAAARKQQQQEAERLAEEQRRKQEEEERQRQEAERKHQEEVAEAQNLSYTSTLSEFADSTIEDIDKNIAKIQEELNSGSITDDVVAATTQGTLRALQELKQRKDLAARENPLEGVPDWINDKPQDARARGYRNVNGHKVDRQKPLNVLKGKEVHVKFSKDVIVTGHLALLDAGQAQPSHKNGQRNPLFFNNEGQPKDRRDDASVLAADNIARNIRPEEITSSITAYTGAPSVEIHGEGIQGNNRLEALIRMWEMYPESAARYKQYLIDHAAEFGFDPEAIAAMERPILVNLLDVTDEEAIILGQYTSQDTETGGDELIKPKNAAQKMGRKISTFANILLRTENEDKSLSDLLSDNGVETLQWMLRNDIISSTQYQTAVKNESLTPEARKALQDILFQGVFAGGVTDLNKMFDALPARAQKAILATAYRDFDSPESERLHDELQASIMAYYEMLKKAPDFANAKNFKEAYNAMRTWSMQSEFDEATGEAFLPSKKYSNFALLLASIYRGQKQTTIQNLFKDIYDLVQGTQAASMFEEVDNTKRSLAEAINEAINKRKDLLQIKEFNYNGQSRSNVLAGGGTASQPGGQGSGGNATPSQRGEGGEPRTDGGGGATTPGQRGVDGKTDEKKDEPGDDDSGEGETSAYDEAVAFVDKLTDSNFNDKSETFYELLSRLTDEELSYLSGHLDSKKSRYKYVRDKLSYYRDALDYEILERRLASDLAKAEEEGYRRSLGKWENTPPSDDFDFDHFISNQEISVKRDEERGRVGHAAQTRGVIRAAKEMQRRRQQPQTKRIPDGTLFRVTDTGKVAVVIGSNETIYLVGFTMTEEDAANREYIGEREVPHAEFEEWLASGRFVPIEERAQQEEQGEESMTEERSEMQARIADWLSKENLSRAYGKTREEIFEEFGNELMPIAHVPSNILPFISTEVTDPRIYCGKGYFIDHALRNHGKKGTQVPIENVNVDEYLNIQSVLDNPDSIKETFVDGKRTVVFIKKIGKYYAELVQAEENGKIVLHKSLFGQQKEPYAKLDDIRQKESSPEGGTSSISHADNAAPAISLQSRDDDKSSGSKDSENSQDGKTESEEKQFAKQAKQELVDFHNKTSTTGRTEMDESQYYPEALWMPLKVDGKASPLAVRTFVTDDILSPSPQEAAYDYEAGDKTEWQLYGDWLEEYNATVDNAERGVGENDMGHIRFATVDAALKFHDWVNGRLQELGKGASLRIRYEQELTRYVEQMTENKKEATEDDARRLFDFNDSDFYREVETTLNELMGGHGDELSEEMTQWEEAHSNNEQETPSLSEMIDEIERREAADNQGPGTTDEDGPATDNDQTTSEDQLEMEIRQAYKELDELDKAYHKVFYVAPKPAKVSPQINWRDDEETKKRKEEEAKEQNKKNRKEHERKTKLYQEAYGAYKNKEEEVWELLKKASDELLKKLLREGFPTSSALVSRNYRKLGNVEQTQNMRSDQFLYLEEKARQLIIPHLLEELSKIMGRELPNMEEAKKATQSANAEQKEQIDALQQEWRDIVYRIDSLVRDILNAETERFYYVSSGEDIPAELDAKVISLYKEIEKLTGENLLNDEGTPSKEDDHAEEGPDLVLTYDNDSSDSKKTKKKPNSTSSQSQSTKPSDNKNGQKSAEKIEDVGEQLIGARKDILKELAKLYENVTMRDLIELPFSKVFKRPDFKKALENGALREKDVQFAEAVIAAFLNSKKPKAGTKDDLRAKRNFGKSIVEQWAERAFTGIKLLRELANEDVEKRDELIRTMTQQKTVGEEKAKAQQQELKKLNPLHEFNGTSYPINHIAFFYDVLSRIDYTPGEKVEFPVSEVKPNWSFDTYDLRNKSGNHVYLGTIHTYEEAINQVVYLTRLANADPNLSHPESRFRYYGEEPIHEITGWSVAALPSLSTSRAQHHEFKTKEEADAFLKEFRENHPKGMAVGPNEIKTIVGYKHYVAVFADPLTGEKIKLGITYSSLEEAREKFESDHDKLDESANKKIAEAAGKKAEPKSRLEIIYYTEGTDHKWYYAITLAGFKSNNPFNTIPFSFADKIKTHAEAVELLNKHKEEWEAKAKEIIDMRNNFVYFDGENQDRIGEDYRKGKDVSAEEFRATFGFRGVQFGNWTNQADRQAAINNAYDSFMDLAKVIGVSPRALSLNGELGIAFGSRGSGGANAHYERDTVVINLTKTRGAGSLAHEWWHALDNYFARQGGMNLGMATAHEIDGIRREMREAFNTLSENVRNSDYNRRSGEKGAYWGSIEEETARLFGEWVVEEMSKANERNHFLSRGIGNAEQRYARMNYQIYAMNAARRGDKVMSFEDFLKTPAALRGFVYPTKAELDQLGADLRSLFDVIQEKVDEETGNTVLFRVDDEDYGPMNDDQRVAYEAVVYMSEVCGSEIKEVSPEFMDSLAEQAGVQLEARRRSDNAERRNAINGTIDEAMSIVTGRPVSEERRLRQQREQERRDMAKKIYDAALQGEFNDVTLQLINKYIDDATPQNPFGRRISQRVPQAMERSLHEGERTNAVDALFTRISESERREAGANVEGARGQRARAKERKKELLKGWAIATGHWHTSIGDFTNDSKPVAEGKDSKVYYSKDGRYVVKFSKGKDTGKFASDIDAANLFSFVFPSTAYDILGYGEIDGKFVTILRQPVVDIASDVTEQERVDYMRSLGFEPINKENTVFSNGQMVVADLQKGNIVKDEKGNIRVIDADVKLHTRDIGGKYTYPDAATDTEQRTAGEDKPRFMVTFHGTSAVFDHFDHSYMGTGEGAQVYGWGSYVSEVEGVGRVYAEEMKKRGKGTLTYKGEPVAQRVTLKSGKQVESPVYSAYSAIQQEGTIAKAKAYISRIMDNAEEPEMREHWQNVLDILNNSKKSDFSSVGVLYTVEIPDNNGSNYIDWMETIPKKLRRRIADHLRTLPDSMLQKERHGPNWLRDGWNTLANVIEREGVAAKEVIERLTDATGSRKTASEILSAAGFTGISYDTNFRAGGNKDGKKNYVIFKESDLKILNRVQFMNGGRGIVYGAAIGNTIYLNRAHLNPNTPIHEHTHLWDIACRKYNPELWRIGVALMKATSLWQDVVNDPAYSHLQTDDEIASEVHARLTGRNGAQLLERLVREARQAKGAFAVAEKMTLIERLKRWLSDFWMWTKDTMTPWTAEEASRVTLEEFINMPLIDLVKGTKLNYKRPLYNPRHGIAPVRGEWTKAKIIKRLKDIGGMRTGYSLAARLISEFDSPQELASHMFYHGTVHGGGRLKPSILMSDREIERIGGGGYGEKYWGVSVSRSKRIASHFSGPSSHVSIYPIVLAKNAKVIEMPELDDAIELDEHIEKLWADGVDAVWIGDKNTGEQELCIINPQAAVNIDYADFYKAYQLGTAENPLNILDEAGIEKLYENATLFEAQKRLEPKKPSKPSRYMEIDGDYVRKSEEQYQQEMDEYEQAMRDYEASDEYKNWVQAKENARSNIRFEIGRSRKEQIILEDALGVSRSQDEVLEHEDAAERIKDRVERLFQQAVSGELTGKPVPIGKLTADGKSYLEKLSGLKLKDNVDFVLNPSDLAHIYKDHFGDNEKDKGQNMPLDIDDVRNMADVIAHPDRIAFFKEQEGNNRNMFYFFKETDNGTYNLLEIYADRKGNLSAKTFYKTRKDATQRIVDLEKSLFPTSETNFGAILSAAKVPNLFEINIGEGEKITTTEGEVNEEEANGDLYRTSSEIDAQYPNWLDGTTTDSGKHTTQVEGTRKTYNKVGTWIEQNLGKDVTILDASSGMGYGTHDLRERGFNVEDVEPYQSEERKKSNPATYSSYGDIPKRYDYIISNAVLNVIPDDWRSNVLHDMAERLKPGGTLFINTRKAGEEKGIKDKIELDSPQEVLVRRNGKIASYQRFFTPTELKQWVQEELGEGYTVEIANESNSGTKGLAAVVVHKASEYTAEEQAIIDRAKADGTYMKAPNGKPSNLNPMRWVRVRTAAFKEWFGDWENDPEHASKVVDENGEPLVVYHGSRQGGFSVFDDTEGEKQSDAPEGTTFFSSSRTVAYTYSGSYDNPTYEREEDEDGYVDDEAYPSIYECFLNIREPYYEDFEGAGWEGDAYGKYELYDGNNYVLVNNPNGDRYFDSYAEAEAYAEEQGLEDYDIREDPYIGYSVNQVAREAREYGTDGAIVSRIVDEGKYGNGANEATDYIVFSPNQIKSATANNGKYSNDNPDIRRRQGSGPVSDEAVSLANDPMSRIEGGPQRSRAEREAFARRERQRMVDTVRQLASRLHLDNVDIVTDTSNLKGRRARAKGFYTKSKNRITIIVPNHASVSDIVRTLLHEAVAHYGLRHLFGERFNTFLDNVYANATDEIRRAIDAMAAKEGLSRRDATEEYLADLAEDTNFERMPDTFWAKIKRAFLDMLSSLGLDGLVLHGAITDNELRYILWRSYENLAEPGRYRNVFAEAKDIAKQYELKVGEYAEQESVGGMVAETANGLEKVNARFNERLDELISNPNQKDKVLRLGRPSSFLLAGGLENAEIELEYDKLVRKSSDGYENEHPFDAGDLKNLPKAINAPLAIFNNTNGKNDGATILTEMKKDGRNFIVVVRAQERKRKGGIVLTVNEITTLFPKNARGIVYWINQRKGTNYDKEKALDWIEALRNHHGTELTNQELDDAANIIRNFENPSIEGDKSSDDGVLFRDGDPTEVQRVAARDSYEHRVRSGMYQAQEALQDSMLGLKEAMEAIMGASGRRIYIEDISGFENAYLGENRLSSQNKAEADAMAHTLFKPLLEEVARLTRGNALRDELTDYMMAKHGLERNEYMARRDAERQAEQEFRDELKAAQKAVDNDPLDAKALAALDDVKQRMADHEEELYFENRGRDYSGLTALTDEDDVAAAEAVARDIVDAYEQQHDTAELWTRVKAVNDAILSKSYEGGLISKETYDKVSAMYEYYIPLRGFDETTSDEVYAYLDDKNSPFNAPIKTAHGRKSKADDPLANMQSMAESTIMQANRNRLVKQRFLNFVLNHPSDLASVSELWVHYDAAADEWRPVMPDNIEDDDTPDDVERKMQAFEERMRQLASQSPDEYKRSRDAQDVPYRVVAKRDLRQHQILVKRGGRDYVITINGSPRAAQAVNGLTNPDNDISGFIGPVLKAGEQLNRQLSAFYTTRNPDFVVSNFMRDMLFANSMVWVKENPRYALRFHRNVARCNPAQMKILFAKHRSGSLDMNDPLERMFHQFIMNGGETGYTNVRDLDKHKNDIRREVRKYGGRMPVAKAWDYLGEALDEYNRAVENCARFAAYITSRQMGRTLERSIYDAKEISVNFNKKGSGSKFVGANGQTLLGNAAGFTSGIGRAGFVFWNAAIQGTFGNFAKQARRHPAKALALMGTVFLAGAAIAAMGMLSGDDDDKDSYWNLPDYVRRSNILFRVGDQWVSIPLPVEYRALYGLGELMTSTLAGKEHLTDGELAMAIMEQVSQLMPIDMLEGGGSPMAFVPSAVKPFAEVLANKSWTGLPIYKDTPWNKEMPEWTKAYNSANKHLVGLSAMLNELTGGDQYTKGWMDEKFLGVNWINPAALEHLLEGYFGGYASTVDKLVKMGETALGRRDYDPRNFLLLNRVLKSGDERTEARAINNEYFRLKREHDDTGRRLRAYERDTNSGIFDYAEKIDFLYNSPEYLRYEIFEDYRRQIDALHDELGEAQAVGDKEWARGVNTALTGLKREMIGRIDQSRR